MLLFVFYEHLTSDTDINRCLLEKFGVSEQQIRRNQGTLRNSEITYQCCVGMKAGAHDVLIEWTTKESIYMIDQALFQAQCLNWI